MCGGLINMSIGRASTGENHQASPGDVARLARGVCSSDGRARTRTGGHCRDRELRPGLLERAESHYNRADVRLRCSTWELYSLSRNHEFSSELEVFRTDVSEGRAKLDRLNEKLAEIESQKQEATTAIARAQYNVHIQKESTTSAVFRLKGASSFVLRGSNLH